MSPRENAVRLGRESGACASVAGRHVGAMMAELGVRASVRRADGAGAGAVLYCNASRTERDRAMSRLPNFAELPFAPAPTPAPVVAAEAWTTPEGLAVMDVSRLGLLATTLWLLSIPLSPGPAA